MRILNGWNEILDYVCNAVRRGYKVVCIGTDLRSDDRAGLEVCRSLSDLYPQLQAIICEYGVENCMHDIISSRARSLVLIDAVIVPDLAPGTIVVIDRDEIDTQIPLTTHTIPVTLVLKLIENELGSLDVRVLGIVVKNLEIGLELSPEVKKGVEKLIAAFTTCLASKEK